MGNLARSWQGEVSADDSAQAGALSELTALAQSLLVRIAATGVAVVCEETGDEDTLACVVSVGHCAPPVGARLERSSGISGRCVRECRTQKSHDTRLDPRVEPKACERLGIVSLAVVPLVAESRCFGLIEAFSDQPGHFDAEGIAAIEEAARSAVLLLGHGKSERTAPELVLRPEPLIDQAAEDDAKQMRAADSVAAENSPERTSDIAIREQAFSVPKFLDQDPARSGRSWPLWAALLVLVLVSVVAATRLVRVRAVRPSSVAQTVTKAPEAQPPQIPSAVEKEKPEPAPATPPAAADPSSDFELLAQRANEGDVHAQMDLAEAYLKGDEVPADRAKAASWYIMAGENGSAEAKSRSIAVTHGMSSPQIGEIRFDVGKMFMQGIGRERDDVSAYKWFELAKAAGDIRAESQEAALEQKMSESELAKARSQASNWLNSHSGKSKKQR